MEEIKELKERLGTQRPVEWDSLPDLNLYMDQVIGYMSRQLIHYGEDDGLTSAMVNNYIKDDLLPRAEGKRYNRTHLVYLTAICALKQVLPVRDAGLLVNRSAGEGARELYDQFRVRLDEALKSTALRLDENTEEAELTALAMELALRSYADKLACQRVVELIREKSPHPEGKANKSERKKKA